MSGEWIPVHKEVCDEIEVIQIASRLKLDAYSVVGRLIRIWTWFDTHTTDGRAQGITTDYLDKKVDCKRFSEAMVEAGWLVISDHEDPLEREISVPKFDRWMGKSGKKRLAENRRKANQRLRDQGVTKNGTTAGRGKGRIHGPENSTTPNNTNTKNNRNAKPPLNMADLLGE